MRTTAPRICALAVAGLLLTGTGLLRAQAADGGKPQRAPESRPAAAKPAAAPVTPAANAPAGQGLKPPLATSRLGRITVEGDAGPKVEQKRLPTVEDRLAKNLNDTKPKEFKDPDGTRVECLPNGGCIRQNNRQLQPRGADPFAIPNVPTYGR